MQQKYMYVIKTYANNQLQDRIEHPFNKGAKTCKLLIFQKFILIIFIFLRSLFVGQMSFVGFQLNLQMTETREYFADANRNNKRQRQS